MTIEVEAGETIGSEVDLRPSAAILIGGACVIGLISALSLPWPVAIASTVLGTLMIAGADVDARTFLLPDLITFGALFCGILAAPLAGYNGPVGSRCAGDRARRLRRRRAGAVSQRLRLDQENRGPWFG